MNIITWEMQKRYIRL